MVKADINTIVLVGVLKDARDLALLRREHRYRIPVKDAPRRLFQYLAFYQPAAHGRSGKCIRYYARVLKRRRVKRQLLLSEEPDHPQADDFYYDYYLGKIQRLRRPLRNIIPRRVTFGYTTLHRLRRAGDMLELYGVLKGEQIIGDALKAAGIPAVAQQYINDNGKRYFLDFAVFCRQGKLAIECDNARAHSGKSQRNKDRMKDAALRRLGWKVIRLSEKRIAEDINGCASDIRRIVQKLGGIGKE